jgi:hypothetical protein
MKYLSLLGVLSFMCATLIGADQDPQQFFQNYQPVFLKISAIKVI